MTITPIKDEQHWHELRANHIGASEIQALLIDHEELELCSDDSYVTMNELYWRKRGIKPGVESSKIMDWGNVMEPLIAHMLEGENNWTIEKCHDYHEHPDYPFLGCTLDYFALETEEGPAAIQIKNVVHTSHKWTKVKATPYVEMQIQQEHMIVNAARKAAGLEPFKFHIIGSMHRGDPEDLRTMYRTAKPDVEAAIIDAGARFWECVQTGREPDLSSPKDYQHIVDMLKMAEPRERRLTATNRPEIDKLAYDLAAARDERVAAEKNEKALKAKLARYCLTEEEKKLYAYSEVETDHHVLTFKEHKRNESARPARVSTYHKFNYKEKRT